MQQYPHEPGHKTPGTSEESAREIKGRAPTLRREVLALLCQHLTDGLTADEAAARMGESVLSIRPRFSELVATGHIRDSGYRRDNISGRSAVVWLAVFVGEQGRLI